MIRALIAAVVFIPFAWSAPAARSEVAAKEKGKAKTDDESAALAALKRADPEGYKKLTELREAHRKSVEKVKELREKLKHASSEEKITLGQEWKIAWREYAKNELALLDYLDERNTKDNGRFNDAIEKYQKEIERLKGLIEANKKAIEERKKRREYLEKTLKEE